MKEEATQKYVKEAEARTAYMKSIAESEKSAARANMQTIANANQSHKLQTSTYAANIAALSGPNTDPNTDLEPNGITSPSNNGVARTYNLVAENTPCDHDGDSTTADVNVPAQNFGVASSIASDGCFIPGYSPR